MPTSAYVASAVVIAIDVAAAALVVIFVWRLFGHYVEGRIFDRAAVEDMRWLGWAGVAAVIADYVSRPLISYFLSQHLGEQAARLHFWAQPNDLLHFMMGLFVVVLAHVLRAGVELAEDNRQIV